MFETLENSNHNIQYTAHYRFPIGKLAVAQNGRGRGVHGTSLPAHLSTVLLSNQLLQSCLRTGVVRQRVGELPSGFFQIRNPFGVGAAAIQLQANGHVLRGR